MTEATMDFLYGLGQVACIIGLLYGAWLSIVHAEHADPRRSASGRTQAQPTIKPRIEYDPLTTHVWRSTHTDAAVE
jgi:hypothetical protein